MATTKPTIKKIVKKEIAPKAVKVVAVKKVAVKEEVKAEKKEKLNLTISMFGLTGNKSGTITLSEEIFGAKASPTLVAQAVRVYLANQRQGSAHTKTRGEVAYSTRKVWQQKGTGRARHGSRKGPIFVGGGITFGPRTRDFSLEMPQAMRRKALFSALSSKFAEDKIVVVNLAELSGKTKEIAGLFKSLSLIDKKGNAEKILFVTGNDTKAKLAAKNIGGMVMIPANLLHTYTVMKSKKIVFVKDSIELLEKTFLKKKTS
jgi:large subunit ribosomal protein L4